MPKSRYSDFMLDIETLGKTARAAIVQIGLCPFNLREGTIGEAITWNVDPHSAAEIDFDTVRWWMGQSDAARNSVFQGTRMSPVTALAQFGELIHNTATGPNFTLWAMPPEFDVTILKSLYQMLGLAPIWAYNATRDLRSLEDIAGCGKADRMQPLVPHDAGSDAAAQASTAIKYYRHLTGAA